MCVCECVCVYVYVYVCVCVFVSSQRITQRNKRPLMDLLLLLLTFPISLVFINLFGDSFAELILVLSDER